MWLINATRTSRLKLVAEQSISTAWINSMHKQIRKDQEKRKKDYDDNMVLQNRKNNYVSVRTCD